MAFFERAVSQQGACLTNVPAVDNFSVYTNQLPGQLLTADNQCKQIYGPTASFCQV